MELLALLGFGIKGIMAEAKVVFQGESVSVRPLRAHT